jgi:hypothetical protein
MSHLEQGERGASHSLAPVQLEGTRVDARSRSLQHDGSGLRLLGIVTALSALALGGTQLLDRMDAHHAHALAAAQLTRSDAEPRDAFMRCALPGSYARTQLTAAGALRLQLERATESRLQGYASVLAGCAPLLTSFRHATQDISAPADVKQQVSAVSLAASELAVAWSALQTQLSRGYDRQQVAPLLEKVDSAWQAYLRSLEEAKRALAARS